MAFQQDLIWIQTSGWIRLFNIKYTYTTLHHLMLGWTSCKSVKTASENTFDQWASWMSHLNPIKTRGRWCLEANLRIGMFNGELVFNRLPGNGWSDLDDFFGRPPWNFNSDEMLKNQPSDTSARIVHIGDFGQIWLILTQLAFHGEISNFVGKH